MREQDAPTTTAGTAALRVNTLLRAPRHGHRRENHDERIDGTKVIRLWMREIVGQREEEKNDGKSYRQRSITLPDAAPTPEAKKDRVVLTKTLGGSSGSSFKISGVEVPVAGPRIDDAAKGHPREPYGMATDVVLRLLHLVVHVGNLTKALVFGKLSITMFWIAECG